MKHIRSLILALVLSAGFAPAFAQAPAPVPALPDTERRTSYVISASLCSCAVNFQLYQDSTDYANWLKVYINGVEIPQSGNWNITSPSGSIATLPRPITNAVLTFTTARTGTVQIVGAQRPRRLSEYAENRGVAARDLNQAINGIEAQLREMWDRQFRVVQAPPGETLNLLPVLASRASMGACFDSGGNLTSCVSVPSTTFAAGTGIGFSGVSPTTISYTGATYSAGNGIQFTGTNPTVISVSANTSIPVISTRTASAAQNLSAYTVILAAGYAAVADAPVTKFKNVGSTPFLDSHVLTGTISAAGTGYVNGTYQFVEFTGGTGTNFFATVTVAGGVVTSVVKTFNPGGYGYTVADVLTATNTQLGGTGSGFTYTVSTVSTPLASFTDTSGAHWQYVPETFIDPRQFGAKFDWNGTDAGATDDAVAIQAALNFASYGPTRFSVNGTNTGGTKVMLPKGMSLVCANALTIYGGTQFFGQGPSNSMLRICDAFGTAAAHFVTMGDPLTHTACFGGQIANMTLSANTANANANTFMLYTNCNQQARAIDNVAIYSGKRGCFRYDSGYGGAAIFSAYNFFCTVFPTSLSDGIIINAGTTLFRFHDTIVEGTYTGNGVSVLGGQITFDGFHTEGVVTGINVNMTVSTYALTVKHASGGVGCTELIKLQATNSPGNFAIFDAVKNGCTPNLVTNGQPAGSNRTTDARPNGGWISFTP